MIECFEERGYLIDMRYLLTNHPNMEMVARYHIGIGNDLRHWNTFHIEPSVQEIKDAEQRLLHYTIALNVFRGIMRELRYASSRNVGTLTLQVEVDDLYQNEKISQNIEIVKQEIERCLDGLARYKEKILFTEHNDVEVKVL